MSHKINKIFSIAFFMTILVPAVYSECLVTTKNEIAYKISHGHAWVNHAGEFEEKKRIADLEMPASRKIANPEEFQSHIVTIMDTKTPKIIPGNRQVYWDDNTGTIVFYDPYSNDCGTAFRPNDGKEYYERVLKRKESEKDRLKKNNYINKVLKQHSNHQYKPLSNTVETVDQAESMFQCDGRTHCSHMRSCAEAIFFLNNCPNTKMDGNKDGIPCEKQWCH